MAVKLGETLKKQLGAVLEMAPNPGITIVKEAVEHGFYRKTNLLDVQSSLLRYFPNLGEHPTKLTVTGVYNPKTFQTILERVTEQGYYETVKKAVWNNDLSIIDSSVIDGQVVKPVARGELVPPKLEEVAKEEGALPISKPSASKIDHAEENQRAVLTKTAPSEPIQENKPQANKPQTPTEETTPKASNTTSPQETRNLNKLPERQSSPRQMISKSSRRAPLAGNQRINPLPRLKIPSLVKKVSLDAASGANILASRGVTKGIGGLGNFAGGLSKGILGLFGGSEADGRSLFSPLSSNSGLKGARGLLGSSGPGMGGFGGGPASFLGNGPQKWLLFFLLFLVCFILLVGYLGYGSGSETETDSKDCPKGSVVVQKEAVGATKEDKYYVVGERQTINYAITVSATRDCGKDFIIEDTVTGKGQIDPTTVNEGGVIIGKKITWNIPTLTAPKKLTYSVIPEENNIWLINEVSTKFTLKGTTGSSGTLNLTGPSRGLMCVPGLDERLLRIFEEAGVVANVSPAILYGIAKAENGGEVFSHSLDGKLHPVSKCGAHGLMQIQHPNDGSGKDYPSSCGGAAPETWDGLATKYNEISGGNLVDADSDKDSIFGAAFYVKDRGQPEGKGYIDQLTETEVRKIARNYLGDGTSSYANQMLNSYNDAFAKQGTCGGQIGAGGVTQPVPGGVNAQ